MGAQEHLGVVQMVEVGVRDGLEAEFSQAVALSAVVDDVAEAEEGLACGEFFFGLADGGGHSEAEA